MNRNYQLRHHLAIAVVIGVILGLTGCDKQTSTGETVGQRVDKAIDKTNETAQKAGDKISDAAKSVEKAAKTTAESVQQKAAEVGKAIDDSVITAAIKAELVKDPGLSALKIDVDTVKGEVTLNGEVDNEVARVRAERLATGVAGVTRVNNALRIKAKG